VKEGVGSRRRTAGSWHGSRAIGQLGNWVRRKAVGWWTSELVDQWIREGSGRGNAKQAIGHLGDWAGGRAVEGWIRRLVEGWRTGPHSAAPIPHSAIRTSSLCQLPAASRLLPYLNRIEGFPNRIQVRRTSTLDVGAFACTPPTWSSTSASSGPRWRRCWRSYASYETQLNRCGSIERELSLIDARERPPAEEIKCDRAAEPLAAALNAWEAQKGNSHGNWKAWQTWRRSCSWMRPACGRLKTRVVEVRGLPSRDIPQARQMLRKHLGDRLVLTPMEHAGQRGYRFEGTGTYGRSLVGDGVATSGGVPSGIRHLLQGRNPWGSAAAKLGHCRESVGRP